MLNFDTPPFLISLNPPYTTATQQHGGNYARFRNLRIAQKYIGWC